MPRIAEDGSVEVWVFADDHNPPHAHIRHPDARGRVRIRLDDLVIYTGALPPNIRRRAIRLANDNHEALWQAWNDLN